MNKLVPAGAAALALVAPVLASAQASPELEALKAQVATLSQKIAEMEAREADKSKATPTPVKETKEARANWAERVAVTGDFRYRADGIDEEGRPYSGSQRVRGRLTVDGKVNETTNVLVQFGTGGSNPRSQDVTLSGDGSSKEVTLRQAYVNWKPARGLAVTAGKIPTPWALNPIDYFHDSDYHPEGLAVKYGAATGVHASAFWTQIAERGSFDDESSMWGAQAGFAGEQFFANVAYQDFQRMQGYNPCFGGNCNGNTLVSNLLANDYNLVQARAGVKFAGVTLFGSWGQNLEADAEDTAYSFGFSYGRVKDPGSWSIGALYQEVEKDALYGGMLDATFAGGRTAHDGFVLSGAYGLSKNWTGSLLWFVNDVDKTGTEHGYDRFQFDLLWKF